MKKSMLVFDTVMLVVYLIAANPAWTGIAMHEWISLGLVVLIVVHIAFSMDWVLRAARESLRKPSYKRTGRLALNALTFLTFIVCVVSGILISGDVLRTLNLFAPGYYLWDPLHSFSAKLLLALIIVHVLVHVRQVGAFVKGRKGGKDDAKN